MRSGHRTVHTLWLACLISFLPIGASLAAPVDCTNVACVVSDNGWTIEADASEKDLLRFEFGGVNHVSEEEFHLGFGTGIPTGDGDQDISSTLSKQSATFDPVTKSIVSIFSEQCVTATVTRKLTGAASSALLEESIALENTCTGGGPIALWVIEWTDWNLNGSGSNDVGSYGSVNMFTQSDGIVTATIQSLQAPTSFDITPTLGNSETTILDNRPSGGLLAGNAGPVGPADLESAFHFNVSLPAQTTQTLRFEKRLTLKREVVVTEIPTLSPPGFLALGLLLAGMAALVLARRRRSARTR